jgi:hypothetical protein
MVDSLLNTSKAKEEHAFEKYPRFPILATNTANISGTTLNKLSDFDKTVIKGYGKSQHDFGSRLGRFTYYPRETTNGLVSPSSYKIKDTLGSHNVYEQSS